jgi:hypothetical protein
MSVFDNWRAIHKARFMNDPTQRLLENKRITSHQMIFYLADVCGVSSDTVTKVIDGFWNYVSDASNHRVQRSKRYLVIPHFGTFRRVTVTSKGMPKEKLRFRSLSVTQLSERLARSPGRSSTWIRLYQRSPVKPETLSVRRRIAIDISSNQVVPLDDAYGLLCAMLDLCAHAFQHDDHKICWFRRGVMYRIKYGRDKHRYSYHQYPSAHVNGTHFDDDFHDDKRVK